MSTIGCVAMVLLCGLGQTAAGERALPVDERAIQEEMDRLVDATGPVDPHAREAAREHMKRGIEAHNRGDFAAALEEYGRALEKTPTDAMLHYELAFTYTAMGEEVKALESCIRCLTLDPKQAMAYVLEASILDDLGLSDRAVATFQRLLELEPDNYVGRLNYGITLGRLEEWEQAEQQLLKAAELSPDAPSPWFHLAAFARLRGHDYSELDYLRQFMERGESDRRRAAVEARLEELTNHEVQVAAGDVHAALAIMEGGLRVLWRTQKHRELHPEARGYFLTLEEEREVSSMLIEEWRRIKAETPQAAHSRYDALLLVADAGYLDAYLTFLKRQQLGERATRWIEAHPERVEAFLGWAREAGLVNDESQPDALRDLPAAVLQAADQSQRTFRMAELEAGEADRFLAEEGRRYRKGLELGTEDRVDCRAVARPVMLESGSPVSPDYAALFRCYRPGDEELEDALRILPTLALELAEPGGDYPCALREDGEVIHVKSRLDVWLGYAMAKAVWRYEKGFREAWGGVTHDGPTVEEEVLAHGSLLAGYLNGREEAAEGEGWPEDRFLEWLRVLWDNDLLRGYVLVEVIHDRYGVRLDRLSRDDARAVKEYVTRAKIQKRRSR